VTGRGARNRDRRTHRIPVRFTYQELATVRRRARNAGRPLARYLREAALGRTPRPLRLQVQNDIAHGLSAIIRQLNNEAGEDPPATIAQAITSLRALLSRLAS
jgi:hypothetical protein